jgi:hypothetical protein
MRLYVEPMDAVLIEVAADGRVRLENEDWSEPTLQEKRAIIYAATNELAALTEVLDILDPPTARGILEPPTSAREDTKITKNTEIK